MYTIPQELKSTLVLNSELTSHYTLMPNRQGAVWKWCQPSDVNGKGIETWCQTVTIHWIPRLDLVKPQFTRNWPPKIAKDSQSLYSQELKSLIFLIQFLRNRIFPNFWPNTCSQLLRAFRCYCVCLFLPVCTFCWLLFCLAVKCGRLLM